MLASVLIWFGKMGDYLISDQSCVNVFCKDVGLFNPGSCTIGWSGYLGESVACCMSLAAVSDTTLPRRIGDVGCGGAVCHRIVQQCRQKQQGHSPGYS